MIFGRIVVFLIALCRLYCQDLSGFGASTVVVRADGVRIEYMVLPESEFEERRLQDLCEKWILLSGDLIYSELRIATGRDQLTLSEQGSDLGYRVWKRQRSFQEKYPWRTAQCASLFGHASLRIRIGSKSRQVVIKNGGLNASIAPVFGAEAEVILVESDRRYPSQHSFLILFVRTETRVSKADLVSGVRMLAAASGGRLRYVHVTRSGLFPDVGIFPVFVPFSSTSADSELDFHKSIIDDVSCEIAVKGISCDSISWRSPF